MKLTGRPRRAPRLPFEERISGAVQQIARKSHFKQVMFQSRRSKSYPAFVFVLLLLSLCCPVKLLGQANLPIYTDHLVNGFQDWGWGTRNFATPSPVHSGSNSISLSTPQSGGISFHQNDFDTSVYTNLTFWAHGGNT